MLREPEMEKLLESVKHAGLKRRWLLIMPIVFITYSLAYLDRKSVV